MATLTIDFDALWKDAKDLSEAADQLSVRMQKAMEELRLPAETGEMLAAVCEKSRIVLSNYNDGDGLIKFCRESTEALIRIKERIFEENHIEKSPETMIETEKEHLRSMIAEIEKHLSVLTQTGRAIVNDIESWNRGDVYASPMGHRDRFC